MRVILLAAGTPPFDGSDFHERWVGGTPAAIVTIAEGFAGSGHETIVGTAADVPTEYRGVRYEPLAGLAGAQADLLILFREWSEMADRISAGRRLFYATDCPVPADRNLEAAAAWAGRMAVMSEYQRMQLAPRLPLVGEGRCSVAGLPVMLADYENAEAGKDNSVIYCSMPDRGLYYLARLFPAIRRRMPDARLVITSDFTLWREESRAAEFVALFARMDGVDYRGAVARPELVKLQRRAKAMAYPCIFPEGFCLAAAECMAAGTPPVTTDDFALSTTVGRGGIAIHGHPASWWYRRRFVNETVRLLRDENRRSRLAAVAQAEARARFDPRQVAQKLIGLATE